jgi:hypothetical protein
MIHSEPFTDSFHLFSSDNTTPNFDNKNFVAILIVFIYVTTFKNLFDCYIFYFSRTKRTKN